MRTTKAVVIASMLAVLFAACSGGGSDDDVTVGAERSRGDVSDPVDDDHMADDHDDHEDDMADGHDDHMADDGAVDPTDAHVVEVEMNEFAYDPDEIEVPAGEPIRFVFHNTGVIDHEAMVGDAHMQEEFEEAGSHDAHAGGHHGDVSAVTVAPGETGELVVTFDEPGETQLGCHLEGHWDAGMVATVSITA